MTVLTSAAPNLAPQLSHPDFRSKIIGFLGYKGGVGKTLFAWEIGWFLDLVLADFEHDKGSVTVKSGYKPEDRLSIPILDAIEKNRVPVPIKGGPRKVDLIPGHPELAKLDLSVEEMKSLILFWRDGLGERNLGLDLHPGGNDITRGAAAAADVIVTPTTMGTDELSGLEGMLDELAGYPIIVVPNKVTKISQATYKRFSRMVANAGVIEGPPVSDYTRWLPGTVRRVAVCSSPPPAPKLHQPFIDEMREVAEMVIKYAVQ